MRQPLFLEHTEVMECPETALSSKSLFFFHQMANNTSQHILGTSANLLGFCLFVITSLHIASSTESHFIDEVTSVIALFLGLSCIFSFASIRTMKEKQERKLEKIADYFFMISLIGILALIVMFTVNFID